MLGRALRRVLRWSLYSAVFVVLLLGLFFAALQVPLVRESAFQFTKEQIARHTGWKVEAVALRSLSPVHLQLEQVHAYHPQQSYSFEVASLSLHFAPHRLFLGELSFPLLEIEGVEVAKESTPGLLNETTPSTSEEESWNSLGALGWLNLHIVHVTVDNLRVPASWLPDDVLPGLGDLVALNLRGQIALSGRQETSTIELAVSTGSALEDYTHFSLAAFRDNNDLVVVARAAEDHAGLYHHWLGLPENSGCLEVILDQRVPWQRLIVSLKQGNSLLLLPWNGNVDFLFNQEIKEEVSTTQGWQSLLGPSATMSADTAVSESQLTLDNIELQFGDPAAPTDISGNIVYDTSTQQTGFHLAIDGLPKRWYLDAFSSEGPVSIMGMAHGTDEEQTADIELLAQGVRLEETSWGDLKAHISLHRARGVIEGSVESSYQLGPVAHSSSGKVLWTGGTQLELAELRWHTPSATVKGDLTVDLDSILFSGELKGEAQDLSWLELYGLDNSAGRGSFSLRCHTQDNLHQGLDWNANLQDASFKGTSGASILLTGSVKDLFGRLNAAAKLTAKDVRSEGLRLRDLTLDLTMPSWHDLWSYKIQTSGKWEQKFSLLAEGQFAPSPTAPALTIANLSGKYQEQPIQLQEPVMVGWSEEGVTLSSIDFQLGSGEISLQVEENEDAEASSYQLYAKRIPIDIMRYYWPDAPASGVFSVQARLKEGSHGPEATGVITLDAMKIVSHSQTAAPQLRGRLEARLDKGFLSAEGHLEGIGDSPVALSMRLPMDVQLSPFHVALRESDELAVKIDAHGDVAPLLHLILPDTTSVSGQARVSVDISGTANKPSVQGNLDLRDCTYEGIDTGCIFKNIQANFESATDVIILKQLTADDGQNGLLSASGRIYLDRKAGLPLDLNIELNKTLLLRRDTVQGTASGQLNMKGTIHQIDLTGNLSVDNLLVTIPKELPTPASSLDIIYVNPPAGSKNTPGQSRKESSHEPLINLDVGIDLPRRAYIRSTDLKSEWRGKVQVTGTNLNPLVNGDLQVMNGSFNMNGRTFALTRGSITFHGDIDKKCQLYIVGADEVDRYTIEAVLKGPLRDPKLHLQSNPYLSQREILSYLIFNQPLGDVSPLEADEVGRAAVDLNSANKDDSSGVMSRLRRLGIDRLDLSTQDNPDRQDLSVNIGKQISRDVYVSVNRGITTESNRFCVEANIIRHVKLRAEVDDDATGRLHLMWKHDY